MATCAPTLQVDRENPDPEALARASALLTAGHLLIYPTDTFYALGGRALDAAAGHAVRMAKGRDDGKPLPLVVADLAQAMIVCGSWPDVAQRLSQAFWPGPLAVVLPARSQLPEEITAGTGSVALRVPRSGLARALCALVGPLVATSANRSGQPSPVTCAEAVQAVGGSAALALDGGTGGKTPSTIVDLRQGDPVLLRAGVIAWEEIQDVLR